MEKKSRKKKAAKNRGADEEVATVNLSGMALRSAVAFGGGDAERGADFLLHVVAQIWLGIQSESQRPVEDGAIAPAYYDDDTIINGFGVTAHVDQGEAGTAIADIVGRMIGHSFREQSDPNDASKSVQVEELSVIAAACVANRVPEFWMILSTKLAIAIWDTFTDAVVATFSDVMKRWRNPRLSIENRALIAKQVKELMASWKDAYGISLKIEEFSRMRGGVSEAKLLASPTPEQRAAYDALVRRVTPVWSTIISMRRNDPQGWTTDAKFYASRRLDGAELAACRDVIGDIPSSKNNLNSARISPVVCAREHARIILGITNRSDDKLKELQTTER